MKYGTILIVDDNEDVLFALNLLLKPHFEKVKVSTTPERIAHFMATDAPEVILLDMNFSRDASSGQEGMEVLQGIQKTAGTVGIISHVEALAESIPAKIEIIKGNRGSSCRIRM